MEGYRPLGIFPASFDQSAYAPAELVRDFVPDNTYATSDVPSIPPDAHPSLRRFSSTFEGPYHDALSLYDTTTLLGDTASPSLNHDNKLLDFGPPTFGYDLVDYAYRRTSITLSAQLQGMFFLAETPPDEPPQAFPELTCYRRNLFSITGTITLPRTLRYIVTDQAEQIPILSQELALCATESIEGNAVKIISVPWKTSATTAAPRPLDDKTEREPTSMPLDITSGSSDADPEYANFPIAFKRLQFRVATANNGRRRELQQHFSLRLRVMATLATGAFIPLCEIASGSIVVRGRSPRNFQAKKEVPLGSGSVGGRRSKAHNNGDGAVSDPFLAIKTEPSIIFPTDEQQVDAPDFSDWQMPVNQGVLTPVPVDPYASYGPPDVYAYSSPELHHTSSFVQQPPQQQSHQLQQRPFLAPLNLSLTDEEPRRAIKVAHTIGGGDGKVSARKTPRLSHSASFGAGNSLLDTDVEDAADRLYEYFPLGLDDWQEPVDAVYRPHLVHHINTASETHSEAVRSRSKRYFSSDATAAG